MACSLAVLSEFFKYFNSSDDAICSQYELIIPSAMSRDIARAIPYCTRFLSVCLSYCMGNTILHMHAFIRHSSRAMHCTGHTMYCTCCFWHNCIWAIPYIVHAFLQHVVRALSHLTCCSPTYVMYRQHHSAILHCQRCVQNSSIHWLVHHQLVVPWLL